MKRVVFYFCISITVLFSVTVVSCDKRAVVAEIFIILSCKEDIEGYIITEQKYSDPIIIKFCKDTSFCNIYKYHSGY